MKGHGGRKESVLVWGIYKDAGPSGQRSQDTEVAEHGGSKREEVIDEGRDPAG